jgi:hypothetical protein
MQGGMQVSRSISQVASQRKVYALCHCYVVHLVTRA